MPVIGRTLGFYFARRFGSALAIVFLGAIALIAVVDFVEMLRRAGDTPRATVPLLAALTLSRAPALAEQMLPFAVLFAAMATFLALSRRLELVVARAAGVSAWQFLAPALATSATIGLLSATVYNPVATTLKDYANSLEAEIFGARSLLFQNAAEGVWLRQWSDHGPSIVNANAVADSGRRLEGVIIFTFDAAGQLLERIEAQRARLEPRAWVLDKVRIHSANAQTRDLEQFQIRTNLTADQVRDSLASDAISFWDLPGMIDAAREAGLSPARFQLQYQGLMARPLMYAAMVVIAAAASLRFVRIGGIAPMILGGMAAGFLLYVGAKLAEDLAAAGQFAVVPAAWGPAAAGALLGFMVLLHQEDG